MKSYCLFGFTLDYLANGNISNQYLQGSYRSFFNDIKEVKSIFIYDKSNRLMKTERNSSKYFDLDGDYTYDYGGNFTSMTRSYNGDNFNYQYYTGTNRLKSITGPDSYTYD